MKQNSENTISGKPNALRNGPDILLVKGDDAERFLQAQLTCDVALATYGTGLPFAWCTPAGRARASGWLLRGEEAFWLLVGAACGPQVADSLGKFILRDQVTIAVSQLAVINFEGESIVPGAFRFQLAGPAGRQIVVAREPVATHGPNPYLLSQIKTGYCELPAGLDDRFIPQMLNLDLTGGVSFTKGCYPGQEIVARTHNLGRVKRRTLRFSCNTQAPPAGTGVFSGETEVGQTLVSTEVSTEESAGVSAEVSADAGTGCELLAVVQLDRLSHGALSLGHPSGPTLKQQPLPYAIPELSQQDAGEM